MKKIFFLLITALLATGCSSLMRATSQERQAAADAAIKSLMTDEKFNDFLLNYKKKMNNPEAKPVLQVSKFINHTDDPEFNFDEIVSKITGALFAANKVELSAVEGILGSNTVLKAPRPQSGLLQHAQLVLRVKVYSDQKKKGNKVVYSRFYHFDIADTHTGLAVWSFSKYFSVTN